MIETKRIEDGTYVFKFWTSHLLVNDQNLLAQKTRSTGGSKSGEVQPLGSNDLGL